MANNMKIIRLELAGQPGRAKTSPQHGYEITAPLTPGCRIDVQAWDGVADKCKYCQILGPTNTAISKVSFHS